jgi:hypothetical protein
MEWLELQREFKKSIQGDNDSVLAAFKPGTENLPSELGLKIYRDGYFLRMRAFLEEDFPETFSLWTEAERKAMVRAYSKKYPSSSPTAADFGASFPAFLAARKWPKELAYLPDLATLEWALVRARNAPMLKPLGFERIATAMESDWERASFRFDPSMQILDSEWPLTDIYDEPKLHYKKGTHSFLIYREAGEPSFRALEPSERAWLQALSTGISIGALCEKAGSSPDPESFADWVKSGLLVAIDWA